MRFLILAALLLCAGVASADQAVVSLYGGAGPVWFDGPNGRPDDFEAKALGAASLSPHISAVGSVSYGFDKSYLAGAGGVRLTATNPDDEHISVGIGIQRLFSSEPNIRPEEWAPDVSIGYVPQSMPKVVLSLLGRYGLDSNTASLYLTGSFLLWTNKE